MKFMEYFALGSMLGSLVVGILKIVFYVSIIILCFHIVGGN